MKYSIRRFLTAEYTLLAKATVQAFKQKKMRSRALLCWLNPWFHVRSFQMARNLKKTFSHPYEHMGFKVIDAKLVSVEFTETANKVSVELSDD